MSWVRETLSDGSQLRLRPDTRRWYASRFTLRGSDGAMLARGGSQIGRVDEAGGLVIMFEVDDGALSPVAMRRMIEVAEEKWSR